MSIDSTGNPGNDDQTRAATDDRGDKSAEPTGDQQTGTNDDRGHRRVETLTREQYADAMHAGGPPVREDSQGGSGSDGRAETEEADRTADRGPPRPHDRERNGDHAAQPEGEPDRAEPTGAEPLTREEYADAVRGNGLDNDDHERPADPDTESVSDESVTAAAVTHFHSEFKDGPLDLYTDGTRWAAAETPRIQETVGEKAELPDRLPTGEELVESADEGSSRLERLRRDVYDKGDDESDALEKAANVLHDVFSNPPTSSYEGTPAQPHIYETHHSGIDAGSVATALFTVGLVIDRAVHCALGYYDKHAKGR